ncbi:hypothetical protein GGR53DRAFT_528211 [Hypoxylon sp. FL1150]|nr:hypothetical protein GGR53DRAFT_528211 [Hypoxylon sp. FL1150]
MESDEHLAAAFGSLGINDKAKNNHEDTDKRHKTLRKETQKRYLQYHEEPITAFREPLYYRTVHSGSPAGLDRSGRPIPVSRLSKLGPLPAKSFKEAAEKNIDLEDDIRNHLDWKSREATPFISVTKDLLRAIQMALCAFHDKDDVTILAIRPWMLSPDTHLPYRDLIQKTSPTQERSSTEILVWGEIPTESILCRWSKEDIIESGLLGDLPSQLKVNMKLEDLRHLVKELGPIYPAEFAKALVHLGMDPCQIEIKQVFLFLFGGGKDQWVEFKFETIDQVLNRWYSREINAFERAVHKLAQAAGKQQMRSQGHPHVESGDHGPSSLEVDFRFCPDFETWWVLREEAAFEGSAAQRVDHEGNRLKDLIGEMVLSMVISGYLA